MADPNLTKTPARDRYPAQMDRFALLGLAIFIFILLASALVETLTK